MHYKDTKNEAISLTCCTSLTLDVNIFSTITRSLELGQCFVHNLIASKDHFKHFSSDSFSNKRIVDLLVKRGQWQLSHLLPH